MTTPGLPTVYLLASLLTSVPLASVRMLNNKDGLLARGQCECVPGQLTKQLTIKKKKSFKKV